MRRFRFAPSPTGYLHIGGARTALFNWLAAKHLKGKFVLRIEDTDINRSDSKMTGQIIESLKWLGLEWDEGPYLQSERLNIYKKYSEKLINENKAYYCICPHNKINIDDIDNTGAAVAEKCRGRCLNVSATNSAANNSAEKVIRFKTPVNQTVKFKDRILGNVSFKTDTLEDFVIMKSDGSPTYHFAVVIDDHLMNITDIIRGNDHLSNTPKQILLYNALGFELPEFAHLPLILGEDKKRLSKRHGAVSVESFRDDGILPHALINYISLLGWSPKNNREFMTIDELINEFDMAGAARKDAVFDYKKLEWLNARHLGLTQSDYLLKYINANFKSDFQKAAVSFSLEVITLLKQKHKKVVDLINASYYFFNEDYNYEDNAILKIKGAEVQKNLAQLAVIYRDIEFDDAKLLENELRALADKLNIPAADLIHPLRAAVTGKTATPGIFDIILLLGKEKTLSRIKNTLNKYAV